MTMTLVLTAMTITIIYADDYSMTVDHQLVIGDGDNGTAVSTFYISYFGHRPAAAVEVVDFYYSLSQASSEHILYLMFKYNMSNIYLKCYILVTGQL